MAAKALTGPGLGGGPVEVGTHAGHGVADSAARGRCRHGGKQAEPAHPAEADLRQIDDEVARSGVQRRDEGGADEGECEHVDVSGQVQHRNTSHWAGLKLGSSYPPKSRLQARSAPRRRPEGDPDRHLDHHPRADHRRPGSIVYHSYVGGVGATNLSWLERNFSITVDGEATPQIVATGTEDWFDSGWYFQGRRDYNTSFHSYVGTDQPAGNVNTVAMATDLWSKWGGVPFTTSAVIRSLPEAGCTTGDTLCWCILYYQ